MSLQEINQNPDSITTPNPQNDDNDWIDIPDVNNVDMSDQNTTMVLRKDTQTKFPNAQNIMSNDKNFLADVSQTF